MGSDKFKFEIDHVELDITYLLQGHHNLSKKEHIKMDEHI